MMDGNGGARPTVLVVEDEEALIALLTYNLEKEGFRPLSARDGEEALLLVEEEDVDLVLLDWMLPNLSGLEVCRQIRRGRDTRHLPVIMLTARTDEGDRVRGLNLGADDYVPKPFSTEELIARVRAVLRRARPAMDAERLAYADIEMDLAGHRVTRSGRPVRLGPTEFKLLRYLLEHPRRVFSRNQLIDAVWGRDAYVEDRTVDVHIRRLRMALNGGAGIKAKSDSPPDLIRTVRAAGYALDAEPA